MPVILLVENNSRQANLATKIIASTGLHLVHVDNFCDAEKFFAKSNDLDGVITTIQMPICNGSANIYAFGENIAALCNKANIPCVICTIMDSGWELKIQDQPLVINKDWQKAINILREIMNSSKSS